MSVKSEKVIGAILGVVNLAALYLLPFTNLGFPSTYPAQTFFTTFKFYIDQWGVIQTLNNGQILALAIMIFVTFAVVFLAAVLGIVPFVSGILGLLGMAIVTFSPYAIFNGYNLTSIDYGIGFYLIWATSVIALVLGYRARRQERMEAEQMTRVPTTAAVDTRP